MEIPAIICALFLLFRVALIIQRVVVVALAQQHSPMSSRNSLQVYNYGVAAAGASTSSLVTSSLSTLADPPIRYMDAATMDYFLIEMVHTLRTSSSVATERTKAVEKEMIEAGLLPPVRPGKVTPSGSVSGTQTPTKGLKKELRESGSTGSLVLKTGVSVADDPEDEALRIRLEAIGVHVGGNIAERCILLFFTVFCALVF